MIRYTCARSMVYHVWSCGMRPGLFSMFHAAAAGAHVYRPWLCLSLEFLPLWRRSLEAKTHGPNCNIIQYTLYYGNGGYRRSGSCCVVALLLVMVRLGPPALSARPQAHQHDDRYGVPLLYPGNKSYTVYSVFPCSGGGGWARVAELWRPFVRSTDTTAPYRQIGIMPSPVM